MSCYLCVYGSPNVPQIYHSPPGGYDSDELGTCARCSVWACSKHGSRYGTFVCAICTPAQATQHAVGNASAPAAASIAYSEGLRSQEPVRARVVQALWTIRDNAAYRQNLAAVIQDSAPTREWQVPSEHIDMVSAVVRSTFAEPSSWQDEIDGTVTTVAGALTLAYVVADTDGEINKPPWQVTNPIVLDPVMWMIATAYVLA